MSTLAEIERAADSLPPEELRQLFVHLAARLRGQNVPLPAPREYRPEQIQDWLARDVAELKQFETAG